MIESVFNFIPGGSEWIIVIVAAGVLLFGAKKIPELAKTFGKAKGEYKKGCLLYTSPSPRDPKTSRMPSSA